MKKIIPFILAFAWLITSCMNVDIPAGATMTVTDALGREVTLKSEPSRIVIVGKQAPMLTSFLYMFNTQGQKLIALEKRSQSTDDFLKLVDSNIEKKYLLEKGAGAEQIVPLNPDVVIMKSSMRDTIGKPMEDLSIPVVYVEFENVDQIYRDIRIFANILNEKQRGEGLISNYLKLYQQIQNEVTKNYSSVKPSVLILQSVSSDQEYVFSVPASNWLQTDLIEKAGGIPVWKAANQAGGWSDINLEQISAWDPEVIFIVNYQGDASEIVNNLKNDEIWQNLKSVKTDKIYAFPYDYLSWDQPDPRWILGYGWLAYRLNPENLTSTEIQSLINTFYEEFFNLEKSVIEEKINTRIIEYLN